MSKVSFSVFLVLIFSSFSAFSETSYVIPLSTKGSTSFKLPEREHINVRHYFKKVKMHVAKEEKLLNEIYKEIEGEYKYFSGL